MSWRTGITVKRPTTVRKKTALSNKQLTRRVRALTGIEGERKLTGEILYDAVTLTAGVADINYFGAIFGGTTETPFTLHGIDVKAKFLCATAGGATLRLLLCYDEHYDGTDMGVEDIFYISTTNSVGVYELLNTRSIRTARNKNLEAQPRCVVLKDILISLNQNEPKVVSFRMPMYNRKVVDTGSDDYLKPHPFVCLLADEANVTASLSYVVDLTTTD